LWDTGSESVSLNAAKLVRIFSARGGTAASLLLSETPPSQATPAKQIRQLQLMLHDLPDVIFEDCEPHDLGEGWND
jgi:ankyrin repeat protein